MTTRHPMRTPGMVAGFMLSAFVVVAVTRPVLAADVTDANAFEKSATASTAAEHEALAAYFKGQAEAAGKEVEHHKQMLAASMSGRNYAAMMPHCKGLIRANQEAQKSYEDLASLHAKLAKDAK